VNEKRELTLGENAKKKRGPVETVKTFLERNKRSMTLRKKHGGREEKGGWWARLELRLDIGLKEKEGFHS